MRVITEPAKSLAEGAATGGLEVTEAIKSNRVQSRWIRMTE